MSNKSNFKKVSLCGEACLEMSTLPNPNGDIEIQDIYDISLMFGSGVGKAVHVNLDDFKNAAGQSVADRLMSWDNIARIEALAVEQERKEREQAAADRAGGEMEKEMRDEVKSGFWG